MYLSVDIKYHFYDLFHTAFDDIAKVYLEVSVVLDIYPVLLFVPVLKLQLYLP